jgi:hypothetical protein
MITFGVHRSSRIFCSPIPSSCRVGLLSPFHVLHHCISLRRWLIFAFSSYVQPPASFKVENCESPSAASIIKQLCRLSTRENVESIARIVVLDPVDGPVPRTLLIVRVRSSPARPSRIYQPRGTRLLTHMITQYTSRSFRNSSSIALEFSLSTCVVLSTASLSSEVDKSHWGFELLNA